MVDRVRREAGAKNWTLQTICVVAGRTSMPGDEHGTPKAEPQGLVREGFPPDRPKRGGARCSCLKSAFSING